MSEDTPAVKTVTLRVASPLYCTSMNFPSEEGDTLVIDRRGTEVPASDKKHLIETAAQHGVTLTESES